MPLLLPGGCSPPGFSFWRPSSLSAGEVAPDRQEEIVAARIMRVLPGVVGIITEVSAEVTVRCGPKDTYVVTPDADKENGTGFIIHPDGWIATNGHVVMPVQKPDEEHVTDFLAASGQGCLRPGPQKASREAAPSPDDRHPQGSGEPEGGQAHQEAGGLPADRGGAAGLPGDHQGLQPAHRPRSLAQGREQARAAHAGMRPSSRSRRRTSPRSDWPRASGRRWPSVNSWSSWAFPAWWSGTTSSARSPGPRPR